MTIVSQKEGQEPVQISEDPKKKKAKKIVPEEPEIKEEPVVPTDLEKEEAKREEKFEKAKQKAIQKALKEQEILNKAKEEAVIHAREVLAAEKQLLKDERKRKREEKKAFKEAIPIEKPAKKVKKEEIEENVQEKTLNNEPPSWFKNFLASQPTPVKKPVTNPPNSPVKPQVPDPAPQQKRPSLVQRRSFDMYSQMFPGKGVMKI